MSDKERISVTLDPEAAAYLKQDGKNASGTINKLVKMEMGEDLINEELIKMRMDNEKGRYEDAARKARGHLERYNQLKQRLEQVQESHDNQLQEALEKCEDIEWEPDNPGLQTQAENAGMEPEGFIEELEEYYD